MLAAIANVVWVIFRDCMQFNKLGVNTSRIFPLEQSVFVYLLCYIIVFTLSVFLNRRKKYLLNTIISGTMAVLYIGVIILMIVKF